MSFLSKMKLENSLGLGIVAAFSDNPRCDVRSGRVGILPGMAWDENGSSDNAGSKQRTLPRRFAVERSREMG